MTESRIWAGGLLAILLLALFCTWVHYTPPPTSVVQGPVTSVSPPAIQPAIPPVLALRAESNAGIVTLTGDVPDAAAKRTILERAQSIYGGDKVIDKLRIENTAKPAGFDAFAANFPPDLRETLNGAGYAQGGRFVLEGEVANPAAKARIEDGALRAFGPGLSIDSRLTVKPATSSSAAPSSVTPPSSTPPSSALPPSSPASTKAPITSDSSGMAGKINFSTSSAVLSKKAKLVLRDVAREIKNADQSARLGLVGFTDSRGTDAVNLKLSERRALAVKGYLTKLGVSAERLEIEAKGAAEPIADNDSVDGRRQNRRVEVRLL
jgi:outer membrane protein OmpA-like peptidoglycan-associated protein